MRDFFTDCGTWGIMEGDYLPRRDNFAMAMQSKGFALLQKKSKYIFVVLVDPKNEEDMEDDSPL